MNKSISLLIDRSVEIFMCRNMNMNVIGFYSKNCMLVFRFFQLHLRRIRGERYHEWSDREDTTRHLS